MMTLEQYISSINTRYKLGNATEHTFRGDLQQLIESFMPHFRATNEPKRQACGAPDYIITKKDIPIGYIEAKDIGDNDLDGNRKIGNKEQFDRYKSSLENIIFTDYLDFHWYKDAVLVMKVSIGQIEGNRIAPIRGNFANFELLLKEFCSYTGQTIKSPKKLAEMMAGKARMLANVIEKALNSDEENQENSSLKDQFLAFRQILIHDIHAKGFADVYAQTIAYGMFAARLNDPSLATFSRQEAAELIPKTNPFLRKLFQYVAGYDLDSRISWIVDGLADVFRATDVATLLKNFGSATQTQDPIIHFYETFLTAYDPALRKARGVWYTPHPVVNFIVRAIDDILKSEFGIAAGIADNSKIKITIPAYGHPSRGREVEVHRVQFLDPATGTATFIAEIIKQVYAKFKGQEGIWSDYVEKHLIPRLNGFEILMASYAMAHLKLDLLLRETGYVAKNEQRFRIYLTNSLEEFHADTGTLFANWLSTEANEANHVKRDTPVMVVIGNPPYSGESTNKSNWIMSLMEDYKLEPGGKEKLNERNPKWINDDYVKFIRYGQHFIEKNGGGILAFINPHGFLDNPTFRGMRWNLLKTFDKTYTLDLHGNSKKKETAPDGSKDENVFDIMQGVSINIFIKSGKKKAKDLGKVFHFDLFGKRDFKYDFLLGNTLKTVAYKELPNVKPNYFFVEKDFENQKEYDKGFKINELFAVNSVGIVTARDAILINDSKENLIENIEKHFKIETDKNWIRKISYRPFDEKFIYFDEKLVERAREKTMKHFLKGKNLGLALCKQFKSGDKYQHVVLSNKIIESSLVSNRTSEITSIFPLYLYPEKEHTSSLPYTTSESSLFYSNSEINGEQLSLLEEPQFAYQSLPYRPNFNQRIVRGIEKSLGIPFVIQHFKKGNDEFGEIDTLDYIYAVLHSPSYREKYKEFLKIDFPRVPYPKDKEIFWQLVELGGEIRQIHLLESPVVNNFITKYPVGGSNQVEKVRFEILEHEKQDSDNSTFGKVWINDEQYFANVPQVVWEFYIGGYQPAQKWLKDRKGRELQIEDILHYQKIIVALSETDRLMKEIDKIDF